jgi:hypothetical protein
MHSEKIAYIDPFQRWLIDNDILFHMDTDEHVTVYTPDNFEHYMDIWITTEKALYAGNLDIEGQYVLGLDNIKKAVLAKYRPAPKEPELSSEEDADDTPESILRAHLIRVRTALDCGEEFRVLIAVIQLPTGAVEVITNTTNIADKVNYYMNSYGEDMRLKTCPDIKIIGLLIV